jgi:excisionase family DNA binding protein
MATATAEAPPLVRLLTAEEVADALGVPVKRIWQLTREGKITAVRLGGRTLRYDPQRVTGDLQKLET